MSITTILSLIGEVGVLAGVFVPIVTLVLKLANGTKCQLRSEMLRIYYHNHTNAKIRQYEYENFIFLYEAYKTLKGNSFIDRIYSEVKKWEIIT